MINATRVGSIDFWRGVVLIAILVDHIPGNLLESLTPRNFGLSDSSEAFVFLSGLSVGMVYLPRARRLGLQAVTRGCLQRALKIYGTHIGLTLAALAIFACAWRLSGVDDLITAHGRSFVFASPATGLAGLALLSHQLGYFNILPLYVLLMLWAPLALALALRSAGLALLASIGVYVASRMFNLDLPSWPEAGGWFFNPFAWQLVFTIGLVSAVVWRDGAPRAAPGLVALSVSAIAMSAMVTTSAAGLAPGFRDAASVHLDLAKQDLGLARLAHFAALAYLVAVAPRFPRLEIGVSVGRAVQSLGRHSLAVFAASSVLSAVGQAAMGALAPHAPAGVEHWIGFTYTLMGIAALFALARLIECRSNPAPSVFPPRSVGAEPLWRNLRQSV
jgi:hypothetical protein